MESTKKRWSLVFDSTKGAVSRRLSMLVPRGDITKEKLLAENGETKVFAVELKTAVLRSNKAHYMLPDVVYKCLIYLSQRGTNEEGIFRMSGSATDILKLKEQFNQGMDGNIMAYPNPHTIAGLLKLFLRELPSPLITLDVDIADEAAALAALKSTLANAPEEHRFLLGCLFTLLNKVSQQEESTKMSIKNLVIVFSAALCCSGSIVTILIKHATVLFPEKMLDQTTRMVEVANLNSSSDSIKISSEDVKEVSLNSSSDTIKNRREDAKSRCEDVKGSSEDVKNSNNDVKSKNDDVKNGNTEWVHKATTKLAASNELKNMKEDEDIFIVNNEVASKKESSDTLLGARSALTKSDDEISSHRRNKSGGGSKNNTPIIGRWRKQKKTIFDDDDE